ncbi:zinc-dependent metalloprotease [Ferrimonas sp. YFM]|uniref:zinc-dependent metalloprotease n=1 Tax=Ferrimonas sp. YFM TaxID=3028878 RepID=UPI002573E2B0|nr:zinc-dependent metalloprotease [Ferrimonas sp. YFM]BDY03315.1 periplasmic metalloprotease [Ferrimonas sp. YFM]
MFKASLRLALWVFALVLALPLRADPASLLPLTLERDGRLLLAEPVLDTPMLLLTSLPAGLGSNDVGLDRGQLGQRRLVQFERHGNALVLRQLNPDYRAASANPEEGRAAAEAFAGAILWRGRLEGGRADLTPLLQDDLHGIAARLRRTGQGQYTVEPGLSFIPNNGLKGFPNNSDIDMELSLRGERPGDQLWQVAADPYRLGLRVRFSFMALPEVPMEPVPYHPQSGFFDYRFHDYGQPLDRPLTQRWLPRFRLEKITPGAAPSAVVKPIVYYLDNAVPEPMRSALLEGASWWAQAFEEAGYLDAFRVELLPEGADPQDSRYNLIQWVHRATRGWSFGDAVIDPRSGEILKGHVTLGSLRVRQDQLIARGLTSGWSDRAQANAQSRLFALGRLKQLAAHEVGHTLGLAHNFAASAVQGGSVMDYPHPRLALKDEVIAIDQAYDTGLGAWDRHAILFGYGEPQRQSALAAQAREQGLKLIGDPDARGAHSAHPNAHLWDNGDEPVTELNQLLQIRSLALTGLGPQMLLEGEPNSELGRALVPLYLLHRYQVEAAATLLGGVEYHYAINEAAERRWVSGDQQRQALEALWATLTPEFLALPPSLQEQLLPPALGYQPDREYFGSRQGVITDPLGMAEVAARHTLSLMLTPQRLNRMMQQHREDDELPSVEGVVEQLQERLLLEDLEEGQLAGLRMRVNAVAVDALLAVIHSDHSDPELRALLGRQLLDLQDKLQRRARRSDAMTAGHYRQLAQALKAGLTDASVRVIERPLPMPPGSPI